MIEVQVMSVLIKTVRHILANAITLNSAGFAHVRDHENEKKKTAQIWSPFHFGLRLGLIILIRI